MKLNRERENLSSRHERRLRVRRVLVSDSAAEERGAFSGGVQIPEEQSDEE